MLFIACYFVETTRHDRLTVQEICQIPPDQLQISAEKRQEIGDNKIILGVNNGGGFLAS